MTNSIQLTKKLTFGGLLCTAGISIGAAYFSLGLSILYSIPPLIAEYSQKNATKFEESIVTNYVQVAPYYMYSGLLLIVLSITVAFVMIYRSEITNLIKKNQTKKIKKEKIMRNGCFILLFLSKTYDGIERNRFDTKQ